MGKNYMIDKLCASDGINRLLAVKKLYEFKNINLIQIIISEPTINEI